MLFPSLTNSRVLDNYVNFLATALSFVKGDLEIILALLGCWSD